MGFDLKRAVRDAFGARTSLLDRILSYMYFADMTVVEQSFRDDFGGGVTMIGHKGSGPWDRAIVLASPLPTSLVLDPGGSGVDQVLDTARFVDLMARIWALSEFEPPGDRALLLAAYRPDPSLSSLRGLFTGSGGKGGVLLGFSTAGVSGGPVAPPPRDIQAWTFRIKGARRGRTRGSASGVASITCRGLACLAEMAAATERGAMEPLYVHPAHGSDFQPVDRIVVDAAVMGGWEDTPVGWEVDAGEPATVRLAGGRDILLAGSALLERARALASSSWTNRGPRAWDPVRLLSLDTGSASAVLVVGAVFPPGLAPDEDEVAELGVELGVGDHLEVGLFGYESSVGPRAGSGPTEHDALPPTGCEWIMGGFADGAVAGPSLGETARDPVDAAPALARMYRDTLSMLLDGGCPWA